MKKGSTDQMFILKESILYSPFILRSSFLSKLWYLLLTEKYHNFERNERTLVERLLNKSNFWASQNTITQRKKCLRHTLLSNYGPIPAPLLSVIEPGIFLHDLTFGLCFGLEGCEDNFDMPLFYLYAIELDERKNVRNICHVYP